MIKINFGNDKHIKLSESEIIKPSRRKRADKKPRVNMTMDHNTYELLQSLAIACNLTPTALSNEIISMMIRNPDFINLMQLRHNAKRQYRVVPIIKNGEVKY